LILFSTLSYLQNNSDFDVLIIEHESGTGVLDYMFSENLKLLLTKSSFRRNRTWSPYIKRHWNKCCKSSNGMN
jgi:hypothetical protein